MNTTMKLRCGECAREFSRAVTLRGEIHCPRCGSYDIEPAATVFLGPSPSDAPTTTKGA